MTTPKKNTVAVKKVFTQDEKEDIRYELDTVLSALRDLDAKGLPKTDGVYEVFMDDWKICFSVEEKTISLYATKVPVKGLTV